jgi:hypothetical protein
VRRPTARRSWRRRESQRSLRDADLAARAALANNRGFVSSYGDVDLERIAAIERALELDDPPQPARHARLLSLLAKELAYAPERARRRALAEEAIALARQAADPRTLAEVLESSCYATWAPDTLATRSEQVRELSALVAQVRDLQVEFVARMRETHVAIELGDLGRADAGLERLQAIAEQTRQPTQRWNAGFVAAGLMCMRGELEAGERLAEQALQLGQEAGQPDTAMIYGGTIVANRMVQGRGAEVITLIERMVAEYPGVPAWEAALAYTCCLIDRRLEGAEILARAAAQHFERLRYDQNRMTALALYSDTAAATHSVEAAAMLHELIKPYADQFIWNGGVSFGHGARTSRCSPRRWAATSTPTRTSVSPATSITGTACACGRPGPSSAGRRRLLSEASSIAPASMPPARSSSHVITVTARSSHARPRSWRPARRFTADPPLSIAERSADAWRREMRGLALARKQGIPTTSPLPSTSLDGRKPVNSPA